MRTQRPASERFLGRLVAEMIQTELSAAVHPRKEAGRIGPYPPATALLAVSRHAQGALPELRGFRAAVPAVVAESIGHAFSLVRTFADRLVSEEKSYRGTLLGLHHGLGCAVLTRAVAGTQHRFDLVGFCDRWLDERRRLVEDCERQIPWFATRTPEEGRLA